MQTNKIDRDEVFNMLHEYYRQRVKRYYIIFLDNLADAIKNEGFEEVGELLNQNINTACKYAADNMLTIAASTQKDAYREFCGKTSDFVGDDGYIKYDQIAFFALRADVAEMLDRAGFNFDNAEGTIQAAYSWLED